MGKTTRNSVESKIRRKEEKGKMKLKEKTEKEKLRLSYEWRKQDEKEKKVEKIKRCQRKSRGNISESSSFAFCLEKLKKRRKGQKVRRPGFESG